MLRGGKGVFWDDETGEYILNEGEEIQEQFTMGEGKYLVTNQAIAVIVPKPQKSWKDWVKAAASVVYASTTSQASLMDFVASQMDGGDRKVDGDLSLNSKGKKFIGTKIPYSQMGAYACVDQNRIEFTGSGTDHRHRTVIIMSMLNQKGGYLFGDKEPHRNWFEIAFLASDFEECAKFMYKLQENKPLPI